MPDETEGGGEKTEAPTPRRRQEAREQGQVARSPDLSAAALLIGILILMRCFGSAIISAMKLVVGDMLSGDSLANLDPGATAVQVVRAAAAVGIAMTPLLLGIVMIAVVVNLAQVGLNLNFARLTPNVGALNPFRGLSRLLGGRRVVMKLVMSFIKVIFVAMTAYSAVHGRMAEIMSAQQLSFVQIFGLGGEIVYSITLRIGFLLLVLALIDYAYQRFQLERDLRMSKQEIKEEMKRMDGDPRIKQRRRQIALQRHLKRLKKEVPTADAVITNPTHFAVALKYDAAKMRAPRVVAKGQDMMALRIREIAIEAGVPLIERPPLARALYKMCDVGDEIPEQFYAAVAEILAYVYQLARNMHRAEPALRTAG
jgi:flagellar biosynthesis protein FlhB